MVDARFPGIQESLSSVEAFEYLMVGGEMSLLQGAETPRKTRSQSSPDFGASFAKVYYGGKKATYNDRAQEVCS